MTETVHIVPVGFTKEKLIDSLKRFPFQKVYLVLGKNENLEGEDRARKTAKEIKRDLQKIVRVEEIYVDKEDVFDAALELTKIIKKERSKGNKVLINVSGSMRTLGIACYLAASITKAEIYSGISKYDEKGKSIGVKTVIKIPPFPTKQLSKEKIKIIYKLYKNNGKVKSLDELVSLIKPELEPSSKSYKAERSKISYHVKALSEDNFVETKKKGKNLSVKLSKLGEIYIVGKILK